MQEDKHEYGRLLWTALRQMQALRDALCWSVAGVVAVSKGLKQVAIDELDVASVNEWLEDQGLLRVNTPTNLSIVGVISSTLDELRINRLGMDVIMHGQRTKYADIEDFGEERSGAGWSEAANFCITSAFLRLLGSWEQYELDVLKSLYHYRPSGSPPGPPSEQMLIEPELHVVYEKPVPDPSNPEQLNYSLPTEWTAAKKKARYNDRRRELFGKKFDVDVMHGRDEEREKNWDRRTTWYEQRNEIAHGRANVVMTLSEYVDAEAFVFESMEHVSKQCFSVHNLVI